MTSSVADSDTLEPRRRYTIEAWLYPRSTGWRTALLKESAGGLAYALYASTNNSLPSLEIQASATTELRERDQPPDSLVAPDSHLRRRDDARVRQRRAVSSRAASGPITSARRPPDRRQPVWGEYFRGLIDEVRIYRRTLTAGRSARHERRASSRHDAADGAGNLTANVTGARRVS